MTISRGRFDYQPLLPGRVLAGGRYIVERLLSVGGMGALVVAADTHEDERAVVIKGLLPYFDAGDPEQVRQAFRRLQHEASLLATLSFPAIPRFAGWFEEQGCPYLVMEYLTGADLLGGLTHLDEASGATRHGLPYLHEDVLRWGVALCRVLEYLHGLQPPVIHQDLKPENIIVDRAADLLWLVDFGTARSPGAGPPAPEPGHGPPSAYGTPGYAPPEQYRGQSEPRSDVYGLAATLYHLLTDDDPREHPLRFSLLGQLGEVGEVLGGALSPDPADRPDAAGLRRALARLQPGSSPLRSPDGATLHDIPGLVAWCEQHRDVAERWLATTLPDQLGRWWDIPGAAMQPLARARAAQDPALLLDTLLAELDPHGYGAAQPHLRASVSELEFGALAGGAQVTRQLVVQNSGRRPAHVTVTAPAWLRAGHSALTIEPGQSGAVWLTTSLGQQRWGSLSGAVELAAGGATLSIPARARVAPLRYAWRHGGRWARAAMIAVPLLAAQLGLWSYGAIDRALRYQRAEAAYEQGDYEAAHREFEALGSHGGASQMRDESRYQAGLAAMRRGDWAAARAALHPIWSRDGVARLLDQIAIQEDSEQRRISGSIAMSDEAIYDLALSRDGKLIATANADGTVSVWDGQVLVKVGTPGGYPYTVSLSPDGELVVLAGPHIPIQAWRWRDGILVWEREPGVGGVMDLAFSPDGQWLYVLSSNQLDAQLDRWSASDGLRTGATQINDIGFWPSKGALSDDGSRVAFFGSGRVVVRSLDGGEDLAEIRCPACTVRRLAFGPDAETMLLSIYHSASSSAVELWDLGSPGPRHRSVHDVDRYGIGLSPDGQTLVTGTDSGMLLFWRVAGR